MSMEDYIISQLYLKLEKLKGLLDMNEVTLAKSEIDKVLEELEKYGQDNKNISK